MRVWTCTSDAGSTGELFHEFETKGNVRLDDAGVRKSLQKALSVEGVCDDYFECWRMVDAATFVSFQDGYTTVVVPASVESDDDE